MDRFRILAPTSDGRAQVELQRVEAVGLAAVAVAGAGDGAVQAANCPTQDHVIARQGQDRPDKASQ